MPKKTARSTASKSTKAKSAAAKKSPKKSTAPRKRTSAKKTTPKKSTPPAASYTTQRDQVLKDHPNLAWLLPVLFALVAIFFLVAFSFRLGY